MATGNGSSLAKIEANKLNAQKSTGPKTQAGKDKSKLNALKHGLVAQATVIPVGEAKESDTEFTQLLDRVMEECEPQGFIEEMLTERIAICYWRLRRAAYAEVGEIRKALDTVKGESSEEDLSRFLLVKSECESNRPHPKRLAELQSTVAGLEFLLALLNDARLEFEKNGYVSEEMQDKLTKFLGYGKNSHGFPKEDDSLFASSYSSRSKQPEVKPKYDEDSRCHRLVEDIEKLSAKKELLQENRTLRHEIDVVRSAIPLDVNRIVRYETTIERQLYKALDKLEELQRRRKAEPQD